MMADSAHPSSDLDVLPGIRGGDPAAYELLYRRYYNSLIDFAESYTYNTAAAEELVADVFAWIYQHRDQIAPQSSLRSYLFGAVRHRALNDRRLRDREASRYERMQMRGDEVIMPSPPRQPDTVVLEQEREQTSRHAVARVLETLSPRARAVLVFRLRDEMSYEEISEIFGITPESVRKQVYRTIASLRDRFPEYLGTEAVESGD